MFQPVSAVLLISVRARDTVSVLAITAVPRHKIPVEAETTGRECTGGTGIEPPRWSEAGTFPIETESRADQTHPIQPK